MDIEAKLDRCGRGEMARDLWLFFCAAGCIPGCHICRETIKVGDRFRLKNFAKKNKKSLVASVMVCVECDEGEIALPYVEAERLVYRGALQMREIDWKKVALPPYYRLNSEGQPVYTPPRGCFLINGRVVA